MRIRNFLIPLVLLLLISLIAAQSCFETGVINGTHYCDNVLEYKPLKSNGDVCANNFECQNQSCIDGLCQGRYANVSLNLTLRTGLIGEILDMIQGIECNPLDQTYHCEGNEAFLCGTNGVWESKGEIPGECGVYDYECGNSILEAPYEQCDDGNTFSNDSCKGDCTFNICGDNAVYYGIEECDDGANSITGDGCSDDCLTENCNPGEIGDYSCIGYYNSTCEEDLVWHPLNLSVGVCGVECLPIGSESCNGTSTLLCNESYTFTDIGLINGKCGYIRSSGGGGRKRIVGDIVIISPLENITYSANSVPLQVVDKKRAIQYWTYSLNGAKKISFTPNTTIFPVIGENALIVYGRETSSTSREKSAEVVFNVVAPDPINRGYCGDYLCQETESCETCSLDCGQCPVIEEQLCGDNLCDTDESSYTCPLDCVALERTDYTPVAIGVAASSIAVLGFVLYRRFFAQGAVELLDVRKR